MLLWCDRVSRQVKISILNYYYCHHYKLLFLPLLPISIYLTQFKWYLDAQKLFRLFFFSAVRDQMPPLEIKFHYNKRDKLEINYHLETPESVVGGERKLLY